MISTNDFKTGQTIKLNNNIYQVMEFLHVKPGKGSAFVRSKLKNLKTGDIIEHTFNAGIKVETVFIKKAKLQFSYIMNDTYCFLDTASFDEVLITKDKLKKYLKYLKEDLIVEVLFEENQNILDVLLPDKISLKVTKTDDSSSFSNAKKNTAFKEALLETGYSIKVPLFIETGENIIINTETGLYLSRDVKK